MRPHGNKHQCFAIFSGAPQAIDARELPRASSYKEIKELLVKEFSGKPFPSLHNLTIPEQDARAPEEDWSAGLPIVRRGIQFQDWKEIADGIILSLEQTENYERERGPEGDRDNGTIAPLASKNQPGKP